MTNKVFQKCKNAWIKNNLTIRYITLLDGTADKIFYRNIINEGIVWSKHSITFKYKRYPDYVPQEITVYRRFIRMIHLYNEEKIMYYPTRTKDW